MNYAVAKKRIQPHALSPGATTGSQIFHTCCWLYLVAFFILPDACGFRLGFLWSAKRIMLFTCYALILFNRKRLTMFWKDIKACIIPNVFIAAYEFIRVYTAVYRTDIYCITGSVLDEILIFYLFVYLFKHEITIEQFLKFVQVCLVILCVEGLWEAATGVNLFGFLNFAGGDVWVGYITRAGGSRICGNCRHSINFGIYLSILFFLSCVDVKKNRLYLFRSPILFVLTSVCVFLTSSRAPLGIYILCVFLICLVSNRDERIKSLIILFSVVSAIALFTMLVYRTGIGRQIMYMLTNMWDVIFDTRYADNWGGTAIGSTEYRDTLVKVFDLWYLNKFMGRGVSYSISTIIDGFWVRSCDNSYVMTYIAFAYPGMIMLIMHGVTMLFYSIKGLIKQKKYLFGATFVIALCYFINIWYVAQMGTYMYIWMLFALIFVCNKNKQISNPKKEVLA